MRSDVRLVDRPRAAICKLSGSCMGVDTEKQTARALMAHTLRGVDIRTFLMHLPVKEVAQGSDGIE